jgi:hypothetical protein
MNGLRPVMRFLVCLGASSLLVLCGCSAIQVKFGWRVSLARIPVAAMQASLPRNPAIAPGEKNPLVVEVTDATGKVLVTEGQGKGKVLWKDLAVSATVVSVNNKGVLTLPRDPRVSDGKTGHVTITAPSHPGVVAELDVPLRYNYAFRANFDGTTGFPGTNGSSGINGSSGSSGSTDPANPSPGGNGGDGTDGGNGSDGGSGGDASPVSVQMTLRPGGPPDHPLLEFGVIAGNKERFYLVDPNGGSLSISAVGGSGGSGGRGGSGGTGGSGGIGTPNGSNGRNGSDGRGGSDGSSGRSGTITVVYDPQVQQYLDVLHLSNSGAPAPSFIERPVPPLW